MNHLKLKQVLPAVTAFLVATFSQAQYRVVLLEERTAGWCPACPCGIVVGENLLETFSGSLLMVAVHDAPAGYSDSLDTGFLPGARVDRISAPLHTDAWYSSIGAAANDVPVADITVTRTYNAVTRVLTATVSAHFLSTPPPGDYRFAGVVVEDNVTNGGSQANMYSGDSSAAYAGIFVGLPNPVPESLMVYQHKARAMLGGWSGVAGSVPAGPQAGQTCSHTFSYTIPASYDAEDVRLYGLLIDAGTGEVLNAAASNYATGTQNDAPYFNATSYTLRMLQGQTMNKIINTFDPESDKMVISPVGALPAWATLNVTTYNQAILSISGLTPGTYTLPLQVTDGIGTTVQDYTVIVDPINDPWSVLGTEGFCPDENDGLIDVAVDAVAGRAYVAYRNESAKVKVYKWNGTAWSIVGGPMSAHADADMPALAVEPISGKPCVAFNSTATATKVMQAVAGNTWQQVGTALVPGGSSQDLVFTNDGTPYLATSNGGSGAKVFTFDGSTWNTLGGGAVTLPGADQVGHPQLTLNADSELVLAFAAHVDAGDSTWVGAATWNGSSWDVLGGGSPWPHDAPYAERFQLATGSDGSVYLAINHSGSVNIYALDGGGWDAIGAFELLYMNDAFDLSVDPDGNVALVYRGRYGRLSGAVYNGTAWYPAGDHFTGYSWALATFIDPNGDPAVVYDDLDNDGLLTAESLADWNVGLEPIAVHDDTFRTYPNPAGDVLNIAGVTHSGEVRILDISGRLVMLLPMRNGAIDLRGLERGSYFVQLPEIGTARFVKE